MFPDSSKTYGVIVYDSSGKEVLEIDNFIHLEPFGTSVKSISKELEKKGIYELEGCYLIKHSRNNQNSKLTNRIHGQGIYEFDGKYWNSVQSDASIWSSPPEKNPEIEALSLAKVRRKQYFYAPVICNDDLDTIIALHNLSYHKDYSEAQILCLSWEGMMLFVKKM